MKYTPDRKSIGQILSMTSPPVIVPDWQRNYSWTTVEVETFWQDLLRFNDQYPGNNIDGQEYFLGAVVIVDTNSAHLLLDGQQRVATASILISVIRDFLARFKADAATRVSTRYLTDYDDALEDYTYKITLNRYDRDFFKRFILESRDKNWQPPEAVYESHTLIEKAHAFFTRKVEEIYAGINNQQEAHQWALRVLKVVTSHVSVVAVISTDEDNASSVFETLNDRGIGLSTTDLLRNLILRRAPKGSVEEIMDLWGEVLEIESDAKLQDFFRHFWISREGDVKARSLYREVKAKIVDDDIGSLEFSRNLRASALVYQDILSGNYGNSETISSLLQSISSLGAKVLLPPALSLLESREDADLIIRYLKYFIAAYVRHSVICKRENSLFENVMYSIAKSIRVGEESDEQLLNKISEFSPDDIAFKSSFETAVVSRRATASYLLRRIEKEKRTTEELDVATPQRVHVEHIYPQTPQDGQRMAQHGIVINRLGNLTLLSARLNTAIKNSAYPEKKPYYEQSELLITKSIAETYNEWSTNTIDQRQIELAEIAVDIWKFN